MLWAVLVLILGLVFSGLMIIYLFYRLKTVKVKEGLAYRYISQLIMFCVVFIVAAMTLPIALGVVKEGTTTYNVLIYTAAIVAYIALASSIIGLILSIVKKRSRKSGRAISAK